MSTAGVGSRTISGRVVELRLCNLPVSHPSTLSSDLRNRSAQRESPIKPVDGLKFLDIRTA